jgi:multiple sugar transport system substrate-binding protein
MPTSIQGQMVLTFPTERATTATLRVASFPSLDRAVHALLPRWRALHPDVAVELSSRRVEDHHRAMAAALADPAAAVPDVIGIEVYHLGRLMALGLEELERPPYQADAARLVPFSLQQARTADGRLCAMPADVGPGGLFYRADVLEKAGIGEEELTGSWEGFFEAGEKLRAATGAALIAHPSYVKDLCLRAAVTPPDGIYFSAAGEPLVRTPRFAQAFERARAARAAGVDARVEAGWTKEWTDGLRSGAIAVQISGAWFGAHLSSWIAPETRGLWRACPLPGGLHASWGGSFYGIPRRAARKDLAWDFIRLACLDREVQLHCFKHLNAFPALLEAQDDPFVDEPIPFLQGQRVRREWKREAALIHAGPVHPLDDAADQAVTDELCHMLEGKPLDQALADAEAIIRQTMC